MASVFRTGSSAYCAIRFFSIRYSQAVNHVNSSTIEMISEKATVTQKYLLRGILVYKPKDSNRDWSPRFSTLRD